MTVICNNYKDVFKFLLQLKHVIEINYYELMRDKMEKKLINLKNTKFYVSSIIAIIIKV